MIAADVIRQAMQELGILSATDPMSGEDADFGLVKLNRILDRWNTTQPCAFVADLNAYPITPGLGAHSIGPTGVWIVPVRPPRVKAASVVEPVAFPTWSIPLTKRDVSWWQSVYNPNLTADKPTDWAYLPEWPNGIVALYPIPTVANVIAIETEMPFTALTLVSTFSMPQGYQDALVLTLAESLAAPMGAAPTYVGMVADAARKARSAIFLTNHPPPPRISSCDIGVPRGPRADWDVNTGEVL